MAKSLSSVSANRFDDDCCTSASAVQESLLGRTISKVRAFVSTSLICMCECDSDLAGVTWAPLSASNSGGRVAPGLRTTGPAFAGVTAGGKVRRGQRVHGYRRKRAE
jgi:hypothetical protein